MPKPSTSPAGRAPVRARLRRLHKILVVTAVALPLVAVAPAGAGVPQDGTAAEPAHEAAALPEVEGDADPFPASLDRMELASVLLADGTAPPHGTRVELGRESHEVDLPVAVIRIEDPDVLRGYAQVVREGRPGRAWATDLVLWVDGEVVARLTVDRIVSQPAIDRIERVGTREVPGATVWDALARCEASGRWDAVRRVNERIEYHGGLQFDTRTWDRFRPAAFPAVASEATREQQIAVAERVLEVQGWGAWPACSQRLELR